MTLHSTGQLVCVCDDPNMQSHTPPEFIPTDPVDGGGDEWSVTRRFRVLEDICYEKFIELLMAALLDGGTPGGDAAAGGASHGL